MLSWVRKMVTFIQVNRYLPVLSLWIRNDASLLAAVEVSGMDLFVLDNNEKIIKAIVDTTKKDNVADKRRLSCLIAIYGPDDC